MESHCSDMQKISSSTSNFSNEFVKLRGMDHLKEPPKKTAADGAISKLGEEVMRLKTELENLEI